MKGRIHLITFKLQKVDNKIKYKIIKIMHLNFKLLMIKTLDHKQHT